ncbi:MAG: sugar O-acetyltransferase [Paludibacteraceae bacterium]|nr:sugar O-acetyltransferase [Paludibacteraceae bacterium]
MMTIDTTNMCSRMSDNPFDRIDTMGSVSKSEPFMRDIEAEMVRSHALCLQISAKKPTDPDYKSLLEELFQHEIDDSVAIVSPFYCDCGCRVSIGKNVIINKGATFISPGKVEIENNVLIAPEVKIATVNHDLRDRHNIMHFCKVTIRENAWIGMGAIVCPGVTVGRNAVVAAGAVVTKDVPDNVVVAGNPAKVIKMIE